MTSARTPSSPRLPVLLALGGLLLACLASSAGLAWMGERDRAAAGVQLRLIERALWLRGEMHALAAAETVWQTQGIPDPLLRAQRQHAEMAAAADSLQATSAADGNQQAHAAQLKALVQEALRRAQGLLADARLTGPSALPRHGDNSIGSLLDRVDSVVSALHGGAEVALQAAESRGRSRLDWTLLLLPLALLALALMLALLHFEARGRRRAEDEQAQALRQLDAANRLAERRAVDLQRLTELGDQLRPTKSIEEISEVLGATMLNVLPQFCGALYLQAPSRNVLRRQAGWGKPNPPLEDLFTPDDCWAVRRGVSYPTEPHAPPCRHLGPGSNPLHVLCVPLVAQGETLGTLHFSGEVPPQAQERRLAQTIADQLALAVSNLRLQENLRVQSVKDPLTGLFNRRYLDATLLRECLRARRAQQSVGVLLLDLDDFKSFNEKHGHEAGDAALAQIGASIGHNIRPEDVAGRFSGGRFLIVLPEVDLSLAKDRAELVRRAVRATAIDLHGRRVEALTCSVGVALFPLHGSEPALCLRAADKALAEAKSGGRDRSELADANPTLQAKAVRPGEAPAARG